MQTIDRSGVISLAEARAQVPGPAGERGVAVTRRGTLDLKLNVLLPPNATATHAQDEIYVVMKGRGVFVNNGKRDRFETGDFLFVASGVEHHFEDFEEVTLWRIYYGVKGGEIPA